MNRQDDLQPRYPMNRRTFVGMVAAGAASTLFQGAAAAAQPAPRHATSSSCTDCSRTAHPGPR